MSKPFAYVMNDGSVVKTDILERYAIKSNPEDSNQLPPKDDFGAKYGTNDLIQPLYNPNQLSLLSEINTYHARCCKTKSNDVAGQGWTLNPIGDNPNQKNYDVLIEFFKGIRTREGDLLLDIFKKAQQDKEEVGYSAVEVIRVDKKADSPIDNLAHIPAHTIRQHTEMNKFMQQRSGKTVWFKRFGYDKDVNKDTGDELPLGYLQPEQRATEIIWNIEYTSKSDYYGLPDSIPATGAMFGDRSRTIYNIAFFENYGVPTYAVTIMGDYDEGDINEETGKSALETAIQNSFADIQKNPHSVMVISVAAKDAESTVDVKFEPLSVETKEASFRLFRQDNRDEVITAHGMDPYRIGVTTTGSLGGNTAKETKKNYKSTTVHPKQTSWESKINLFIIQDGFGIYDWEFKFAEIDTEDETEEINKGTSLFNVAVLTPNDLIRRFGDKWGVKPVEHPAMNAHYINGQPIDYVPEAVTAAQNNQAIKTIENLQERLIEVVKNHDASNQTGSGDGTVITALKRLKHAAIRS